MRIVVTIVACAIASTTGFSLRPPSVQPFPQVARQQMGVVRAPHRLLEPSMSVLKAAAADLSNVLDQARMSSGVVVVHFTSSDNFLSNNLVSRCADAFSASMLYGGPACSVIELEMPAVGTTQLEDAKVRAGITELPTTQVWSQGTLFRESVAAADLEAVLGKLGARSSRSSQGFQPPSSDYNSGSGAPSATAVDDIDFTGGAGNTGRPNLDWGLRAKGKSDAGRTTADRFPDWFGGVDKPGDGMRDGEEPGQARARKEKDRDDRPPGFDGRS